MNPTDLLYEELKGQGLDFFVSVPCKFLGGIIERLEQDPDVVYTPVTREEEGVGIMAGAYLAGKRPAMVMQNSGFGNSINAVCSLLNFFKIPCVFIISHRGTEHEPIEAQNNMGLAIRNLMKTVDVDCHEIPSPENISEIEKGITGAREQGRSVGFLFPLKFWNT